MVIAANQLLIKAIMIGSMLVFAFYGQSSRSVWITLGESLVFYLALGLFLIPPDDRILAVKPEAPK